MLLFYKGLPAPTKVGINQQAGSGMRNKPKRFYGSHKEFQQIHFTLKQTTCPRCKTTGTLNLHGYLRGYDDKSSAEQKIRGKRIFCSNRNLRPGCGKTFSVLAVNILKKFIVSAAGLWRFLKNIAAGLNKINAFKIAGLRFSHTTCYRLWKRFSRCQTKIRTRLLPLCHPPELQRAFSPAIQTITHLRRAFKNTGCPVTAFQKHFQTAFL
jgi:hypothetical protein